ncbi:MAG: diacylglyceryl transferase [Capnocytophaga felis]|nr:diacylglyceryl transferase [Capnocytophaga felis]
MLEKLKKRWNVTSNTQVWLILITFTITGSLSAKVSRPFCDYIGLDFNELNPVLAWILRLIIILPIYQIILLIVGTLLGQFRFFWEFEKKMLGIRKQKTEITADTSEKRKDI